MWRKWQIFSILYVIVSCNFSKLIVISIPIASHQQCFFNNNTVKDKIPNTRNHSRIWTFWKLKLFKISRLLCVRMHVLYINKQCNICNRSFRNKWINILILINENILYNRMFEQWNKNTMNSVKQENFIGFINYLFCKFEF